MRSYVLLREFEPKNVACVQGREVRIPKSPADLPYLWEPVSNALEGRFDTVTLLAYSLHEYPSGWKARFPGQLGYHDKSGTIFHTGDFPVWEWLLLEILANLAEQWRATRYSLGENLVGHRYLRTIWWLCEGVPMDALMTPDEQVEWDRKWAPLWANSGFKCPVQCPDYTKHVDVWWDFDRCFVEAA